MVAPAKAPAAAGVLEYAERVLEGDIVAGQLVRLACERHVRDLERDDVVWDADAADRIIRFFPLLPHTKGEWARPDPNGAVQRIHLELWQQFIVGSVFGWKRPDGLRRFRRVYQEVARKNSKTTMVAGIGLYLYAFEGEPGAEVYTAATKKDQAKISWNTAAAMVLKTPGLQKLMRVVPSTSRIMKPRDFEAVFRPLSKDDQQAGDGLNPYAGLLDELHQHPTPEMVDLLETGMGARLEPLLWMITTAGSTRYGVCWREREYARNVLEGTFDDDAVFAYIATIDEDDDPFDQAVWPKANPNLIGSPGVVGGSVHHDYLVEQAKRAHEQADRRSNYLRKHMNVWVGADNPWLNPEDWQRRAGNFDVEQLRGRPCYAGLDLGRVRDLSSLVLVFPPEPGVEGPWYVLAYFWCPEQDITERSRRDRVPYDVWARDGLLTATPGNATDFDFIEEQVREIVAMYDLQELGYDRWAANQLITHLTDDGIPTVGVGQGYASMSAAIDEAERLIITEDAEHLVHDGHPILAWMAGNAVTASDPAGNRKLDKDKSRERIDGMVAMVMAIGRAALRGETGSIYDERGLRTLGG